MEALGKDFVSCKGIVPISEANKASIHGKDVVLSQRFPYQRLHDTLSTVYKLDHKLTILASKYIHLLANTLSISQWVFTNRVWL